ncbi:response regulator [Flavobacterium sp.]|jgi:signal transduction histidine kinase/CheY-like chemotaxis protein|uniref:response regulator n=1 Tax=Flavobacterium sp. TaxID=239 RepID=UPI0037BF9F37
MADNNLNRNLNRQINKFLSDEIINDNPSIQKFIQAVSQSYENYEKDAELFEQSIRLNDLEFYKINSEVKGQLEKRKKIQAELIQAIKILGNNNSELEVDVDNLTELLEILHNEIEYKKESEEQLSISKFNAEKANEAKSEFLSIMSHEIRTPLNAIIGLIYIMEKERTVKSFNENFDVLKTSAQNLFLLLNNILDFNKIEAGKIELETIPFNFKDLVLEIVRSLQAKALENQNKIEVIIDDKFQANIVSDPLRISQIFTNLILNAIKFTKNGLIQVKIDQVNEINNHSVFKVQISDNGIGIDVGKFNSIFQKFAQADTKTSRQYGGSGLGLVITKNLLNLFHSDIELESEIGTGSKFSFVLNLPIFNKNSELKNELNAVDYEEQKLEGLKVLLVEDNLINVKIAEKILKQWGVNVDVALNGLIAVEKHKSTKYDIILMDLSMPVMDGFEATINIRSIDSSIPIIALTASTSYLSLEKAMQIGINEYITKPFNPRELNLKLSKYYNSF